MPVGGLPSKITLTGKVSMCVDCPIHLDWIKKSLRLSD